MSVKVTEELYPYVEKARDYFENHCEQAAIAYEDFFVPTLGYKQKPKARYYHDGHMCIIGAMLENAKKYEGNEYDVSILTQDELIKDDPETATIFDENMLILEMLQEKHDDLALKYAKGIIPLEEFRERVVMMLEDVL